MAMHQHIETAGGEGDESFVFENWIHRNGLNKVKDAFVANDMITMNCLRTDNAQFAKLMSHPLVLKNAALIPNIINSINSLMQSPTNINATAAKIFISTQNESKIFNQIESQQKSIKQMGNELNNIYWKFQETLQKKHQNIKEIENNVQQTMSSLREKINMKEKFVNNQIGKYKMKINEEQKEMELKIKNYQKTLETEKEYFDNKMLCCKDIMQKYDEHNKQQRESEIMKIGQTVNEYYEQLRNEMNKNHQQIANDTFLYEMQESSLVVNEKMIDDTLDQFIVFSDENVERRSAAGSKQVQQNQQNPQQNYGSQQQQQEQSYCGGGDHYNNQPQHQQQQQPPYRVSQMSFNNQQQNYNDYNQQRQAAQFQQQQYGSQQQMNFGSNQQQQQGDLGPQMNAVYGGGRMKQQNMQNMQNMQQQYQPQQQQQQQYQKQSVKALMQAEYNKLQNQPHTKRPSFGLSNKTNDDLFSDLFGD